MSDRSELRIGVLYPDLLNVYADRGNVMVLAQRCRWREIPCSVTPIALGDRVDPNAHDLLYLGGGQDRDMALCASDLVNTKRQALADARDRGAIVLGVCGGFQLLGHEYRMPNQTIEGLGLVDLWTSQSVGSTRLVGDIALDVDLGLGTKQLVGFENHAGRTHLGPGEQPLGTVRHGHGNNGDDGLEGVKRGTVLGTYLHGPLLAKNAWLADWLIATALGVEQLPALDDRLELLAHTRAYAAALGASS